MKVELSEVIARPPVEVFRFLAIDHVRNHPRWDPNMSLEQITPGPIGVGTVFRRSYLHGGTPVSGEMEVTEFEPDQSLEFVIRDGPVPMISRATFTPEGDDATRLTLTLESDAPVTRMDPGPIQQSLQRMKELIESAT